MGMKAKPMASVDEAIQRNFEIGIVAGMRLAIQLPGKMAELERETFNQKLAEERAGGNVEGTN